MAPEPSDGSVKPAGPPKTDLSAEESKKAAVLIQKTYRGHRTRRELNGFGLDASTRWYEAVRDAQFKAHTSPQPPISSHDNTDTNESATSPARLKWSRATEVARRAGADDRSPSISEYSSDEDIENAEGSPTGMTQEEREAARRRRAEANAMRKKTAKMMDLQYFLEMVDQKHRYGSNLRKYHAHWKTQDTDQNFFYWLDQGDGRNLDLPECSRARLDKEQVRYLSREERLNYLVRVNDKGLLIWAKNGELVWTKDELFKDSVNGIVPIDDSAPKWKYNVPPPGASESDSSSSDESEDDENTKGDEGERYVNEEFHRARGIAKVKYVSAAVLFNHMIRTSLKKGHKWIFVCDTSFRLYIGYKQSGAFQHSSFLYGARILSAGLIKVKHGQLRRLSPLSGHYRPPAANFRAFVHSLRDEGVDMSHVSISRSYAVLVGLESYTKTRKRIKAVSETVVHEKDKLLNPEKVKMEEEAMRDKSESAEKERLYLEQQREAQEREARERRKAKRSLTGRFSSAFGKLKLRKDSSDDVPAGEEQARRILGTGPEDGVPPPEGHR
ncbi:uncharacterized protein PV07_04225 [Cladophialophora immunda]|uniref:IQ domain-containing protein IQM6 n=1 Tax=Cladophialophora immunda TaxID=569365 RepID=A0A0D1ZX09_9EURO|nr:uncharacterized protein PV07_04225 [Cladophialophora immunda]KIW32696.1 hypothetical protein PV07_04225 [Cladophialophora immunda]